MEWEVGEEGGFGWKTAIFDGPINGYVQIFKMKNL